MKLNVRGQVAATLRGDLLKLLKAVHQLPAADAIHTPRAPHTELAGPGAVKHDISVDSPLPGVDSRNTGGRLAGIRSPDVAIAVLDHFLLLKKSALSKINAMRDLSAAGHRGRGRAAGGVHISWRRAPGRVAACSCPRRQDPRLARRGRNSAARCTARLAASVRSRRRIQQPRHGTSPVAGRPRCTSMQRSQGRRTQRSSVASRWCAMTTLKIYALISR